MAAPAPKFSRETTNDSAYMDEFMAALEAPIEDFVPVYNADTPNDKKTHKEKLEVCVVYFFRYCSIPQVMMAHDLIVSNAYFYLGTVDGYLSAAPTVQS
jgi:hypothetical protein